jgi:hypothetical protein
MVAADTFLYFDGDLKKRTIDGKFIAYGTEEGRDLLLGANKVFNIRRLSEIQIIIKIYNNSMKGNAIKYYILNDKYNILIIKF